MRPPRQTGRKAIFSWDVHPIWRGIGCLMMVLIPALAYGTAYTIFDLYWPAELGLKNAPMFIRFIGTYERFWVVVVLSTLVLIPALMALLSTFLSLLFSLLGGDRTERVGRFLPKDRQ
jgi:hypothetical protein